MFQKKRPKKPGGDDQEITAPEEKIEAPNIDEELEQAGQALKASTPKTPQEALKELLDELDCGCW